MKIRKWSAFLCALASIFFIAPMLFTAYLYNRVFGRRVFNDSGFYSYLAKENPGFRRMSYRFSSDRGQLLQGYFYYYEGNNPGSLIVMAHGMGGGHDSYLAEAEFLARQGYLVFAYDGTGANESEGKSLIGLPQSAVDLHYALTALEHIPELSAYPFMLYGHSWGGFAVTAVLNYPHRIKAVVSVSGFENSTAILRQQGRAMVGDVISVFMPYVRFYEFFKFGFPARHTGVSGLSSTDASVLIIHSRDDEVVDFEDNYLPYKEAFSDNPRFTFLPLLDHGHNALLSPEARLDIEKIRAQKELYPDSSAEYTALDLKEKELTTHLDPAVTDVILRFFNKNLK